MKIDEKNLLFSIKKGKKSILGIISKRIENADSLWMTLMSNLKCFQNLYRTVLHYPVL